MHQTSPCSSLVALRCVSITNRERELVITALVQFTLSEPISAETMLELSEANAALYKGKDGLHRKYYVRSEDGVEVGGIYLWESKEAAQACYDEEWLKRVTESYGSAPVVTWLETPVVVDNRHDEIVIQD